MTDQCGCISVCWFSPCCDPAKRRKRIREKTNGKNMAPQTHTRTQGEKTKIKKDRVYEKQS